MIDLELAIKALNSSNDGIIITENHDNDHKIIYANKAFEQLTGYSQNEILNKNCRFLQNNDQQPENLIYLRKRLQQNLSCRVKLRNYRKNGEMFWNELSIAPVSNGGSIVKHFIGIQKDVTDEVNSRKHITYLAKHDSVTDLYNFDGFIAESTTLFNQCLRNKSSFSVALIDLDDFKHLNDQLGHIAANNALYVFASQLKQCLRKTDIIGRFGGDEFCFCFSNSLTDHQWIKEKIDLALDRANKQLKTKVQLSASLGICTRTLDDTSSLNKIMQQADHEMYKHKKEKKLARKIMQKVLL